MCRYTRSRTCLRAHAARPRHARRLVERGGRADVRIEPAGRCGHQVHGDRLGIAGISRAQPIHPFLHLPQQLGGERSQVRARGAGPRCGVEGVIGMARRGRGTPPKVLGPIEGLADQL